MKRTQLKKLSLAYAMALCCQPLLGMENQYQNSTNINIPQLYNQNQQRQIPQQPQFSGNLQHNTINWMNTAPQNQIIPLPSEYVNTPTGLYVINQVIHQTVYLVQQPQQYNPMPMFQNQQTPMLLSAFSGNPWVSQGSMNDMTQQGHYIHQNTFFQPGFQNNGDNQQGARGMKRNSEHMGFNEKAEPQKRQKQEAKKLTRMEMNVHKMLLMKAYMNNMSVPKELSDIITWNLHDVTHINPVLDGKLIYTPNNGEKATFNIKDLVETNGCIDLSNNIFGDTSKYFLITTDLEEFFRIDKKTGKLVMLIAPRFLIEEKIGSSAKPFEPIMANWKEEQAPIGIFWRMENWDNLREYDYITSENVTAISNINMFRCWEHYSDPQRSEEGQYIYINGKVEPDPGCGYVVFRHKIFQNTYNFMFIL
jgi:hypothetical protein